MLLKSWALDFLLWFIELDIWERARNKLNHKRIWLSSMRIYWSETWGAGLTKVATGVLIPLTVGAKSTLNYRLIRGGILPGLVRLDHRILVGLEHWWKSYVTLGCSSRIALVYRKLSSHFRSNSLSQWNVTSLLGDFGWRIGFYIFLQSSTVRWRPPSLNFSLIALSFGGCVHACRPEGL